MFVLETNSDFRRDKREEQIQKEETDHEFEMKRLDLRGSNLILGN